MGVIKDKRRGTYTVIWREVVTDASGQRVVKQRWRRGFRTKNEAGDWERTNVPDRFSRYHHVPTLPPTMPFGTFVEQVWRPAFAARSNAPATRRAYEQILANHILPALGTRPVRDLDRVVLHDFLAAKRRDGLSAQTVRGLLTVLQSILGEALDRGLVKVLPTQGLAKKLRLGKGIAADQDEIRALDREQLARFLAAAREVCPAYLPLFLFLARTGTRIGEALALRWDSLNLNGTEPSVRIDAQVTLKKETTPPKYGSKREVPLSPETVAALKGYHAAKARTALRDGRPMPERVFCTRSGSPMDRTLIQKALKRALKEAGLPATFTVHCLRHTFASLLFADGAPLKFVSDCLGHKNAAITARTYACWLKADGRAWIAQLDEATVSEVLAVEGGSPEESTPCEAVRTPARCWDARRARSAG
jgi:integrase